MAKWKRGLYILFSFNLAIYTMARCQIFQLTNTAHNATIVARLYMQTNTLHHMRLRFVIAHTLCTITEEWIFTHTLIHTPYFDSSCDYGKVINFTHKVGLLIQNYLDINNKFSNHDNNIASMFMIFSWVLFRLWPDSGSGPHGSTPLYAKYYLEWNLHCTACPFSIWWL